FEYRVTNRGGQGVANIVTNDRNGGVVASFPVKQGEQLMLVTDQGKIIRTTLADVRIAGRNTQGVTIFNVAKNEKVVSVALIDEEEDAENEAEELVEGDLQGDGKTIAPTKDGDVGSDDAAGPEGGE
ncbi:MAG: DNA gyrase subunit A, partial [Sphingomonadaceae bacterium]